MKLALWIFATLSFVSFSFATSIDKRSLDDQVRNAAFIVFGRVTDVTMTGRFGWAVRDPNALTGPGSRHRIWLSIELDCTAVLKGGAGILPSSLKLPLWQGWVKDLRSEREASLGKTFIFFLSSDVQPASEMFQHLEFERAEIEKVLSQQAQKPNQSPEPTPTAGTSAAEQPLVPAAVVAHL